MTVDEFLVWAEGQPGRYELCDGTVFAMAPENPPARKLIINSVLEDMIVYVTKKQDCSREIKRQRPNVRHALYLNEQCLTEQATKSYRMNGPTCTAVGLYGSFTTGLAGGGLVVGSRPRSDLLPP